MPHPVAPSTASRPPGISYGPPGHGSAYVRQPVCPPWMPRDEFDAIKHDPEQLYEACHKRVQEFQQTLETTRRLNDALLQDTQYQYAHAVQQFEELRQEHLSLNDSYNDLETVNETVQEVVEVLRTDKHQLLVELNSLKREISVAAIENTQLALKEKEALAFQQGITRKTESQEDQLRQLDGELREYSQTQVQVANEIGALESAAHNLSLQSASLSELRTHLDTTRLQQEQAIRALEAEIEQKQQEAEQQDAQLWDFKREMSARILALQHKVQQAGDELARLHRLSEHEMNTLSQQNRALNDEVKNKTDQLFGTRKEMTEFSTAARREINIKREEIQQCLSIVDLVERQNQGLESSIARMLEQNRISETQIQEKDNINNKNLIEQANFIAMVHMELQTVREDLYMIKSRLCHHCRERLLADEAADDAREQQLEELERLRQGAEAYAKSLVDHPSGPSAAPQPGVAGSAAPAPANIKAEHGAVAEALAEAERERQRMKDELRKSHEALEALNRQLLEEREARTRERREDEDARAAEEEERLARLQDEEARRRRQEEDERRKGVGEDAKAFTVRFPNGTKKKIDAFMADTVQDFIDRICTKTGLRPSDMFYVAHAVNENSVLGMVDRFLDRHKTMYDEGVTPKCNINFKFKHYKRPRRWGDLNAQERFCEQLQRNVVTEAYPMTEKLAVHLAGLELQTVFGDATGKKRHSYFDKVGLDAYLPVSVTPLDHSYWQERLFLQHKKHKGLSPAEARTRYIDALRTRCSHWGMTFFDIRDKENRPFVAGVAEDGLHILSADKRVFLQSLLFQQGAQQLAGWEKSSTGLFVKRRESSRMTLFASSKLQSQEMYNLLNEYYLLLPREHQQAYGIAIPERDQVAGSLPSPDLFEPPVEFRRPPVEFESPVEYLKTTYLEQVFSPGDSGSDAGPCLKFVELLDKVLDDETVLTDLDISDAYLDPLDDGDLMLIADLLVRAREYDPDEEPSPIALDRRLNWVDNLDLQKFNIGGNDLGPASLPEVRRVLETFHNLTEINLSGIALENKWEESLVQPMLKLNLHGLTLRDCRIGDRGLNALLELFQNRTLRTLDLNNNRITQNGMAELCGQLDQPYCSLTSLSVGTNKIAQRGLETLINVMERARRPMFLDFSDNPLGPRGGKSFGKLVEQHSGITHLDISNSTGQMNITGDVGLYITRQLLNNPEIRTIIFSDNPVGTNLHQLVDPAGQLTRDLPLEFFTFLERTAVCNVEKLLLNRCGLNHDHGAALTSALVDNYKLKELEVSGNRLALGDGGLPQGWMDLLEMTQTLERLDFSRNGLQGRGTALMCNALGKNRSLKYCNLDCNRFSEDADDRWDEVMYMFATNRTLTELSMCEMGIGDDLLERIAEGLGENRSLKTLTANKNQLSAAGVVRATKHFVNNVTLETLDISCDSVQADEEEYMRTYKMLIDGSNLDTIHL